jgi:hypothetical protein
MLISNTTGSKEGATLTIAGFEKARLAHYYKSSRLTAAAHR